MPPPRWRGTVEFSHGPRTQTNVGFLSEESFPTVGSGSRGTTDFCGSSSSRIRSLNFGNLLPMDRNWFANHVPIVIQVAADTRSASAESIMPEKNGYPMTMAMPRCIPKIEINAMRRVMRLNSRNGKAIWTMTVK